MDFFVVGDERMVLGFGLVGISGKIVNNSHDALDAVKQAVAEKIRIILIDDRLTPPIQDQLQEIILKMDFPLVIEIPSTDGVREGKQSIRELLKSSVGISV